MCVLQLLPTFRHPLSIPSYIKAVNDKCKIKSITVEHHRRTVLRHATARTKKSKHTLIVLFEYEGRILEYYTIIYSFQSSSKINVIIGEIC